MQATSVGVISPPATSLVAAAGRLACIRRGWYFSGEAFREKLLKASVVGLDAKAAQRADGDYGEQLQGHGERRARTILAAGLKFFELTQPGILSLPYNDSRKLALAELIRTETVMRLDWIRGELGMGDRAYCSHLIGFQKCQLKNSPKLRAMREKVFEITKKLD